MFQQWFKVQWVDQQYTKGKQQNTSLWYTSIDFPKRRLLDIGNIAFRSDTYDFMKSYTGWKMYFIEQALMLFFAEKLGKCLESQTTLQYFIMVSIAIWSAYRSSCLIVACPLLKTNWWSGITYLFLTKVGYVIKLMSPKLLSILVEWLIGR